MTGVGSAQTRRDADIVGAGEHREAKLEANLEAIIKQFFGSSAQVPPAPSSSNLRDERLEERQVQDDGSSSPGSQTSAGGLRPIPLQLTSQARQDGEAGLALLDSAATALYRLAVKCQRLEQELDGMSARQELERAEHARAKERWEASSSELKMQLDCADTAVASFKVLHERSEARAKQAEDRLLSFERTAAAEAEVLAAKAELARVLNDRIVSAFGRRSKLHPILEALESGHEGSTEVVERRD